VDDLNLNTIINLFATLFTLVGAISTAYVVLKKVKPETRKIRNEGDSAIGEAAESIANGAKTSTDLLLQRILEMEKREKDRDKREEAMRYQLDSLQSALQDWQDWARRLVHQLRSHGLEPVPFKPSPKEPRITDD